MSKKKSSKLKTTLYFIFSFLIAVCLCLFSVCILLESTILNSDFIFDNMNSSNYFVDKKDEIGRKLTDLGYASGLDEEFFEGFVDEVMISKDSETYLQQYYSGKASVIDTKNFKDSFNTALDKYIKDKGIKNVDSKSREYLIKTALKIYRGETELPLFNSLSFYVVNLKAYMKWILGGILGIIAILACTIYFTSNRKYRAVRFFYFSTAGAFLVVLIPTVYLMVSDKIAEVNVVSRALYNLLVECAGSAEMLMLFYSLAMGVISVGLYILQKRLKDNR